jgi:integrase
MASRKRRVRSPHPGVVLIKPSGAYTSWRARYTDPDTDRDVWIRIDPVAAPTAEARREWAIRRSKTLARRKMEIEAGEARITRKPLSEAIKAYFDTAEDKLRDSTVELYRAATDRFKEWAEGEGIVGTEALTATKLPGFRDYLLAQRKQGYVTGGGRGARKRTREKLSPQTINWQLRAVKTVLNHLRLRGVVALSRDAISDALTPTKVPREAPEFLSVADCGRLIEAALRHDADTVISREEEERLRREARARGITRKAMAELQPEGTTPRHPPVAPFVATVLLTGMRVGEVLALKWSDVDLEAIDDGKVVGEIRLRAGATKTAHARTIGLEVSPALRTVLAALKLRAGSATYVFGGSRPMLRTLPEAARRRLVETYGAPPFSWQTLRRTCGTYLSNAAGIFGAASAYRSARQLGHSVQVAEKHYLGLVRSIPREARTLEAAMQIEDVLGRVVERVSVQSTPAAVSNARGTWSPVSRIRSSSR